MTAQNKQLIVFVKTPLLGRCKTRLIPLLGEQATTDFYKSLVLHCFKQLENLQDIVIQIHAYPDIQHHFLKQLSLNNNAQLVRQKGDDLGDKMLHAMQQSLKTFSRVVLIGTDCPTIDKRYITLAFDALDHHDIVFGPASDGGYVLIGANTINPIIFSGISWSTEKVLEQSLLQAKTAGYKIKLLPTLNDIDTPDDYLQYQISINQNISRIPNGSPSSR